jgi:hypothetical protein
MTRAAVKTTTWDHLPLYATDAQIGEALLGPRDAWQWTQLMVPALEKRGLPALNAYNGRRYCPAVRSFLDRQEGVMQDAGRPAWNENFDDPKNANPRRARRA